MNEQPIRKKHMQYPKDFVPAASKAIPAKRFTFNQDYQIEVSSIKKYQQSIEDHPAPRPITPLAKSLTPNPEKVQSFQKQSQQEDPLNYHITGKHPDLDQDLLKKPRFSVNDKQEIDENVDQGMLSSMSPGCIRRQIDNRQAPLPLEETCKIELLKSNSRRNSKISNSYIKFQSTGELDSRKWLSSEKDFQDKFKGNKSKVQELPKVGKSRVSEASFAAAKEQYNAFRRKQEFLGNSKVTNLLASMQSRKQVLNVTELPRFESGTVERIKQQINGLVRNKKNKGKKQTSSSEESDDEPQQQIADQKSKPRRVTHFPSNEMPDNRPELLVSYRSSLSYLKDLYYRSTSLGGYHLVVKIPKLFIQQLIYKDQDREQLYETARKIFHELKIPHENLVIKKYTNCTMLVARNVCLIWHFDGRRYLGGWQAEYLDEGCKHGLGLEWEPRKYVYYGEYIKNKKHGLGIYKDKHGINYIGHWIKGQRADSQDPGSPYGQEAHLCYEAGSDSESEYEDSPVGYQYL